MRGALVATALASNVVAVAAGIGLTFVATNVEGRLSGPILLYVLVVTVPPVMNSLALLARRPRVSGWVESVHLLALVILIAMLVEAWMLSGTSGVIATPFMVGAAIVNAIGVRALSRGR